MDPLPLLVQHSLDEKASNQTMAMAHLAQHISVSKHASFASARPASFSALKQLGLPWHSEGYPWLLMRLWQKHSMHQLCIFRVIEILLTGDVWVLFTTRVDGAWIHLVCNYVKYIISLILCPLPTMWRTKYLSARPSRRMVSSGFFHQNWSIQSAYTISFLCIFFFCCQVS